MLGLKTEHPRLEIKNDRSRYLRLHIVKHGGNDKDDELGTDVSSSLATRVIRRLVRRNASEAHPPRPITAVNLVLRRR